MASFHECTHCRIPVFASAAIGGQDYVVVNAACLSNPQGFVEPVPVSFGDESAEQRALRWQRNWSALVKVVVNR